MNEVSDSWLEVMNDIHTLWEDGVPLNDPHIIKECPKLSEYAEPVSKNGKELLSCRSLPFYCFFHKRKRLLYIKGKKASYEVSFPKLRERSWNLHLQVKLKENEKEKIKSFELSDDCLKAKLPLQAYNHGKHITKSNTWHSGDVHYWVDKYLVRNIDLDFWELQKYGKLKISQSPFSPAHITKKETMKNFCEYRRGRIMTSRLVDAVTYYKSQKNNAIHKKISPYPFSVRASSVPHHKISQEENTEYVPNENDCHLIHAKECLETNKVRKPAVSLGWSGVGELLGGPLEYVDNVLYPRRNLVLSSYYFPYKSFVHRAGIRGHWDEEGVFVKNFNFFTRAPQNNNQPFHISFRCSGVLNQ